MARHHKKSRKTRRRTMRGGSWLRPEWLFGRPAQVAADGISTTVTDTTAAAADALPSAPAQAAALGSYPGGTVSTGAPILGSTASMGGRRRHTRKHRKHRKH
jgi:hypothetical protein